jgi:hypothetical protein
MTDVERFTVWLMGQEETLHLTQPNPTWALYKAWQAGAADAKEQASLPPEQTS